MTLLLQARVSRHVYDIPKLTKRKTAVLHIDSGGARTCFAHSSYPPGVVGTRGADTVAGAAEPPQPSAARLALHADLEPPPAPRRVGGASVPRVSSTCPRPQSEPQLSLGSCDLSWHPIPARCGDQDTCTAPRPGLAWCLRWLDCWGGRDGAACPHRGPQRENLTGWSLRGGPLWTTQGLLLRPRASPQCGHGAQPSPGDRPEQLLFTVSQFGPWALSSGHAATVRAHWSERVPFLAHTCSRPRMALPPAPPSRSLDTPRKCVQVCFLRLCPHRDRHPSRPRPAPSSAS